MSDPGTWPQQQPPAYQPNPLDTWPAPKKNRAPLIGLIAVAVIAAVVGAYLMFGGDDSVKVRGNYTLFDFGGVDGDIENCEGTGGYSDFDAGTDVTVRDNDGTIIGTGALRNIGDDMDEYLELLVATDEADDLQDAEELIDGLDGGMCPMLFDVDLPKTDFYEFQIGSGNRGEITYSLEDLEEDDFIVSIVLGD